MIDELQDAKQFMLGNFPDNKRLFYNKALNFDSFMTDEKIEWIEPELVEKDYREFTSDSFSDKLLKILDVKQKNAERLIVEPPQDALDTVQNDISSGYVAACEEIRTSILGMKG